MQSIILTRRIFALGGLCALPACGTLAALDDASRPMPTFDLSPATDKTPGSTGSATFQVTLPVAPAVLQTDRWLVRPGPGSVSYLPDARWPSDLPAMLQSLMVRSLSATGRVGYVGPSGVGPIPDYAVLSHVDRFEIAEVAGAESYTAHIEMNVTLLRDATQKVVGTRMFKQTIPLSRAEPLLIVAAFQSMLDIVLADMASWIIGLSR
jgi:cholesterol transport system auxiliary component